jgi:uncharacterized coiled-coil protein SlyX
MKSESNKSESTHQDEIVQGYRGLLNWGQRVAGECGIVGTQSNFKVIEDTLNRQKERIVELEAENASQCNHISMLEQQVATYGRWLRDLKDENAALVSQSAGGAGIEVEEVMVIYSDFNNFNTAQGAYLAQGYRRVEWQVLADERVAVMWQRPAQSED